MRIQSLAFCLLVLSAPVSAAVERPWEISLGSEKILWIAEPMNSSASRPDLDAEMKSAAHAVDETFAGEPHDDLLGLAFPPNSEPAQAMISSMSLLPMTAARREPWLTGARGSSNTSGTPRPVRSVIRSSFVPAFPQVQNRKSKGDAIQLAQYPC